MNPHDTLDAPSARAEDLRRPIGGAVYGRYLNFVERPSAAEPFFAPEVAERLRAVRDTYDLERLLQANHEIGAGR